MRAPSVPARVAGIAAAEFDVLNARADEMRASGRHVISLGQALPPFGPPKSAIDAAREALAHADAHVYSADAGLPSLREAIGERIGVAADEIIVTAGANQAFLLALMTLVDPADEVLLPAPYFVNHDMAVRAVGAVPVEVPLDRSRGFPLEWPRIEPFVTRRTRAVAVCTPSNPTGAVAGQHELARIARELASRAIVLLVDETYGRFLYDTEFESAASLPGWQQNVVVVNTFSKAFGMAGWRVGYMAADRSVCAEAIKIQDAMIICAPVVSQMGVEAAVRRDWEYPRRFAGELAGRRQALADGLRAVPRLRWTPAAGGFFAFVNVDGMDDSTATARALLEREAVVTIPGAVFGRTGEGFLRLSYGAVTRAELAEACSRLQRFFAA